MSSPIHFAAVPLLMLALSGCMQNLDSTIPAPTGELTQDQVKQLAPEILWHLSQENTGTITKSGAVMKGWAHAIPIASKTTSSSPAKIEMDYLRISRYRNDTWTVIEADDYNDGSFITKVSSAKKDGALYTRYPWYNWDEANNRAGEELLYNGFAATERNSVLSFTMDASDKIYHWWTQAQPGQDIRVGDGFQIEAKVRISGAALFQIGVDLKDAADSGNVSPACTSDWYGSTEGEFISITVTCSSGYVKGSDKNITFNIKFNKLYSDKIDSVQIFGGWNNWKLVNMTKTDSLNYSYVQSLAAGSSYQYNIQFVSRYLNALGDTDWAAKKEGKSVYVDSFSYTVDGLQYTPVLEPNGLTGTSAGSNLRVSLP